MLPPLSPQTEEKSGPENRSPSAVEKLNDLEHVPESAVLTAKGARHLGGFRPRVQGTVQKTRNPQPCHLSASTDFLREGLILETCHLGGCFSEIRDNTSISIFANQAVSRISGVRRVRGG